jgi:ribosomal protein S18 acetylase RimI-like enzyme
VTEGLKISKLEKQDKIPYALLLLADPSQENIDKYLPKSAVYILEKEKQVLGCYVLFVIDTETAEIKNIAIDPLYQGKGMGTLLLRHAIDQAKSSKFKKLIIGTGNSSVGQLYLYQKLGFRIYSIIKDFFIRNYNEPIIENGIVCKDMIMLEKEL